MERVCLGPQGVGEIGDLLFSQRREGCEGVSAPHGVGEGEHWGRGLHTPPRRRATAPGPLISTHCGRQP